MSLAHFPAGMSRTARHLIMAALIGALALFALAIGNAAPARAAAIGPVTSELDNGDGTCDDTCTLRDAIDAANASSDNDTITIGAFHIVLTQGELVIDKEGTLAINGVSPSETIIDGNNLNRVFAIDAVDSVTFSRLTITGGNLVDEGAGIFNSENSVELDHVAVKGNTAAECGNFCPEAQTGQGDGGGIYNDFGFLYVHESEISGNTADGDPVCGEGRGGGIYNNGGGMILENVTISDNAANDSGTECRDPGLGGGIFEDSAFDAIPTTKQVVEFSSLLVNLTIANNSAGLGGGIATDPFQGGIFRKGDQGDQFASLALLNTIVANNTAAGKQIDLVTPATSGPDNCYDVPGLVGSLGHNLESDTSCGFGEGGDQQDKDPLLGGLTGNGGLTQTRALLTGSPAIDTATNDECPGTDQRDVTRPQNVTCDIGAYEVVVATEAAKSSPAAAQAAQAVKSQLKPTAKSSISGGRKSCTRTSASARVSGQNIATVTYSLDGRRIKKAKGNKTSVRVNASHLSSGTHKITAKITYSAATGAKAQTKRVTFVRCARKAVVPKFTG